MNRPAVVKREGYEISPVAIPEAPGSDSGIQSLGAVIRAYEQGDGATLHEYREQIPIWLREFRDRRNTPDV